MCRSMACHRCILCDERTQTEVSGTETKTDGGGGELIQEREATSIRTGILCLQLELSWQR